MYIGQEVRESVFGRVKRFVFHASSMCMYVCTYRVWYGIVIIIVLVVLVSLAGEQT